MCVCVCVVGNNDIQNLFRKPKKHEKSDARTPWGYPQIALMDGWTGGPRPLPADQQDLDYDPYQRARRTPLQIPPRGEPAS